jgi:hypothetical protein
MKKIFIYFAIILVGATFSRCGEFEDINTDPDAPSQPDTRFLFVGAVRESLPTFYINSTWNGWTLYYPQYISERNNVQYTTFMNLNFSLGGYYTNVIRPLDEIIALNTDEATKDNPSVLAFSISNDNQIAAARTLKAYTYMHLTDIVGALPYSEANQGGEGNFYPVYDSQESIYTSLNQELEDAYAQFDEDEPLDETYEILYNGDIDKWKKFNASVRLQLAIKLFKVNPAKGKTDFAKAYNQGFIRDNDDILEYKYLSENANCNPLYSNNIIDGRWDYWPSATIIDAFKEYDDPRLEVFFTESDSTGYNGIPFAIERDAAVKIDASYFAPEFYAQNAPAVLITPSITLLAAAEAAEYGWISDNAANLYAEAVTAALEQRGIDDADIASYLANPKVAYKIGGSQTERLAQIATQKWFASLLQDGMEAWADYRRFGVPDLQLGPIVTNVDAIPRRRIYDSNDYIANRANYDAAIAAQGADLVTTRLWWDK